MTVKQRIIITLTKLAGLATAINAWLTADDTTDVDYGGVSLPSRAKQVLLSEANFVKTDSLSFEVKKNMAKSIGTTAGKIPSLNTSGKIDKVALPMPKLHRIRATKSGVFFVRNQNGTLPEGVEKNKVWDLSEQAASPTVIVPDLKNHIEMHKGELFFTIAGGGQGGGGGYTNRLMVKGGSSSLGELITVEGGAGYPLKSDYNKGGKGGKTLALSQPLTRGNNGNLQIRRVDWSSGAVNNFVIGGGGKGAETIRFGTIFKAENGEPGWIEVEYVSWAI